MSELAKALQRAYAQLDRKEDVLKNKDKVALAIKNFTNTLGRLEVLGNHYAHQHYLLELFRLEPAVSDKERLKEVISNGIGIMVADALVSVRDAGIYGEEDLAKLLGSVEALMPYASEEIKKDIRAEFKEIAMEFDVEIKQDKARQRR